MECLRDSDTAPPPRTDGCLQQCLQHDPHDPEEGLLSAPTGRHAKAIAPQLFLSLKTGKTVSTGRQKVQPSRHMLSA